LPLGSVISGDTDFEINIKLTLKFIKLRKAEGATILSTDLTWMKTFSQQNLPVCW